VEALQDLPSLGRDRNGSCLWAAASYHITPCILPPQPPPEVLLLAPFFLTFWDCHSTPSNIFCASSQKRLHIQVWATSKPNACESSLLFKQPSRPQPNPSLPCTTLQETSASPPTACYEAGWVASSNRRPPLPSFSSPSLWAWRKKIPPNKRVCSSQETSRRTCLPHANVWIFAEGISINPNMAPRCSRLMRMIFLQTYRMGGLGPSFSW